MPVQSLHDITIFPAIDDLPDGITLSMGSKPTYPERRWCFIAEIVKVHTTRFHHTEVRVKDKTDTMITVVFDCKYDDPKFLPERLRPRHTLLVLYAVVERLLGGGMMGVVVGDVGRAKVVPVALNNILEFSKDLAFAHSIEGGKRVCYGCQCRNKVTFRCPQCKLVYYCNRECQEFAFKYGDHRYECYSLWDKDFAGIMQAFNGLVLDHFLPSSTLEYGYGSTPLNSKVPSKSASQMAIQLVNHQVKRDRARTGESQFMVVRKIIAIVDYAVNILGEFYNDRRALRDSYTHGLSAAVVGFSRPPLHHLAYDDSKNSPLYLGEQYLQNIALVAASWLGLTADMGYLIDNGALEIESEDGIVGPPLHAAALGGHIEALEFLIDGNTDLDLPAEVEGDTALHLAAMAGHEDVVEYLLRRRVNLDPRNFSGLSPLLFAAAAGNTDVVRTFLGDRWSYGIEINANDDLTRTPLIWAVRRGHLDIVELLLERCDVDVNCEDPDDFEMTPLSIAAVKGREDIFQLLVSHQFIDIHAKDSSANGILKHAVIGGNENIVRKVLELPAVDIDLQGADGSTPFMWAAGEGRDSIVKLLIDKDDIDVNWFNNGFYVVVQSALAYHGSWQTPQVRDILSGRMAMLKGASALDAAARNGHESTVNLLLDHPKIDADAADYEGRTALSTAASAGHLNIVKLFLDRDDIAVNDADCRGFTAIASAARDGQKAVVHAMLEYPGIDVKHLILAAALGSDEDMVKTLLETELGTSITEVESALKNIIKVEGALKKITGDEGQEAIRLLLSRHLEAMRQSG
ncbi:ankyrin repeat-containing domain protein [Aspergillus cavernicola]|uniref:Ankyrin repeat-containing domain protein n=1 Tax=Aspergillus cavernicola TaxID=176166 RepID=A0ABR4HKJ2_9EURO